MSTVTGTEVVTSTEKIEHPIKIDTLRTLVIELPDGMKKTIRVHNNINAKEILAEIARKLSLQNPEEFSLMLNGSISLATSFFLHLFSSQGNSSKLTKYFILEHTVRRPPY